MVPYAMKRKGVKMIQPKNNQEFYKALDETCMRLREVGMDMEANRIMHRLHNVPWNSTSELFEEFESVLKGVLSGPNATKLTPELKENLHEYIRLLEKV
jgi:hypothetical protein